MAIPVLILGESGTGKTYSTKHFNSKDVKILSVHKPVLSYRDKDDKKEVVKTPDSKSIIKEMLNTDKKSIVIDDFQYILGLQSMRRSLEKGWDKFSEMQYDYFTVLDAVSEIDDDVIVYFMSHTEVTDQGDVKVKTIGKALDKYITIEGLFTIVLGTKVSDGQYYFITQNDGKNTLKSPEGMFDSYAIDNDLAYVDAKIRSYYEIGTDYKTDEEMAEADAEAKREEITKPEPRAKRRRAVVKPQTEESGSNESEEPKPLRQRKHREEVAEASANVIDPDVPAPEEAPKRRRRRVVEE